MKEQLNQQQIAKDLLRYIDASPSMFHAVEEAKTRLERAGFTALDPKASWQLEAGGKYYVTHHGEALAAFVLGTDPVYEQGFVMVGSHVDAPGFRVKTVPDLSYEAHYSCIHTEVYGGPILMTWLDRPLSVAGRAFVKDDRGHLRMENFCLDEDLCLIPNLAIHLNREVNEGFKLNPQKHLHPLMALKENQSLKGAISASLDLNSADQILAMDAFLYDRTPGTLLGLDQSMISIGRLDNLAMAHASLEALVSTSAQPHTQMIALFNHEEVGSQTISGAGSPWLVELLKRITLATGESEESFYRAMAQSLMISADQAHAVHPLFGEKHDPSHRIIMGQGPVIKVAANQSYTSNAESMGHVMAIAQQEELPIQVFHNRSDVRGGSTIGPINLGHMSVTSIDIGNPILAMHSIRELGSIEDHANMISLLTALFSHDVERPIL